MKTVSQIPSSNPSPAPLLSPPWLNRCREQGAYPGRAALQRSIPGDFSRGAAVSRHWQVGDCPLPPKN